MNRHEALKRQFERMTALRVEEFMAQRMDLLDGAVAWIEKTVDDDYEVSVHEVVMVAEFLAGERGMS